MSLYPVMLITFVALFSMRSIMSVSKFHTFQSPTDGIELPETFTNPFHYTPHPLCLLATKEVQAYLETRNDWREELEKGKMFGVLVVRKATGEIGFLAAFSGNLAHSNNHDYFVPPVYDLLQPDGFFKIEEEQITAINHELEAMQHNPAYLSWKEELQQQQTAASQALQAAKTFLKTEKERRARLRETGLTADEDARLIQESQFQKAEYKRLERKWKAELTQLETRILEYEKQIQQRKQERKKRSAALQLRLFAQFNLLNARGETKDLCEIFAPTAQQVPPAGAGECAAPKLLQYAYLNQLRPIAMAEFWWGNSPKTEIRRHGYFYPACKGKCEPILKHMLIGLPVTFQSVQTSVASDISLEILYEDNDLLVVNKPAGMLSVPGKEANFSVYDWARKQYPEATGPLIVHRLDMATSGLLLIAKKKEVHQHLQAQFKNRTIRKRYIARLDGIVGSDKGSITLPLCPDPQDRPRQIVHETLGKPAITTYEVLQRSTHQTWIAFYPHTGRTHQLRVHAAHPDGLNAPIEGDTLYGRESDCLYLHAELLEFDHPITGKRIHIEKPADFYPTEK